VGRSRSANLLTARSAVPGRRLQHRAAAFLARLQDSDGYVTHFRRNRSSRYATQGLRALASCSRRANRRINRRGSNRRWKKIQGQVMANATNDPQASGMQFLPNGRPYRTLPKL